MKNKKPLSKITDFIEDYEFTVGDRELNKNKLLRSGGVIVSEGKNNTPEYKDNYKFVKNKEEISQDDEEESSSIEHQKEHIYKIHKNCIDIGMSALKEANIIWELCRDAYESKRAFISSDAMKDCKSITAWTNPAKIKEVTDLLTCNFANAYTDVDEPLIISPFIDKPINVLSSAYYHYEMNRFFSSLKNETGFSYALSYITEKGFLDGRCIFKITWNKKKNIPNIKYIPNDSFLIDPKANVLNPLESSPFFTHIEEMYVYEFKTLANKRGWKDYNEKDIYKCLVGLSETEKMFIEDLDYKFDSMVSEDLDKAVRNYEMRRVRIYENFIRYDDKLLTFYSLSNCKPLETPKDISEVYPAGIPFVYGIFNGNAKSVMPKSAAYDLIPAQDIISLAMNITIDAKMKDTFPDLLLKASSGVNPAELTDKKFGKVIQVGANVSSVNDILFERKSSGNSDAILSQLNNLNDFFVASSGISTMSFINSNNETATSQHVKLTRQGGKSTYYYTQFNRIVELIMAKVLEAFQHYGLNKDRINEVMETLDYKDRYDTELELLVDELDENANLLKLFKEVKLNMVLDMGLNTLNKTENLESLLAIMKVLIGSDPELSSMINKEELAYELIDKSGFKDKNRLMKKEATRVEEAVAQVTQEKDAIIAELQQKLNNKKSEEEIMVKLEKDRASTEHVLAKVDELNTKIEGMVIDNQQKKLENTRLASDIAMDIVATPEIVNVTTSLLNSVEDQPDDFFGA